MRKLCNSNFELIQDIIKDMDLRYAAAQVNVKDSLNELWKEVVEGKFFKTSEVGGIQRDDILLVICADSFTANELYLEKSKFLEKMKEKTENMGIKLKDIKFDYKKWEDRNYEKEI